MEEPARKVLKQCKGEIIKNLILTDGILDMLEEREVLTEDMVEEVKDKRTDTKKINKLLDILKKRGPTAFNIFVEAIRPDFLFLADSLESKHSEQLQKFESIKCSTDRSSSDDNSDPKTSMDTATSPIPAFMDSNCNRGDGCLPQIHKHNTENSHIKTRTDPPTPNLGDTIKSIKSDQSTTQNGKSLDIMQEKLNCLYSKLKTAMTNSNMRELSFKSPEPITIEMVDMLLDDLLKTVDKCYSALGANDRSSLLTYIIDIKESNKKMNLELSEKEKQKNKYADNIIKLQHSCRNKDKKIVDLGKQIKKLHDKMCLLNEQNQALKDENETLTDKVKERMENESENEHRDLKEAEEKFRILITEHELVKESMEKELKFCMKEIEKLKRKLDHDQKSKFAYQNEANTHGVQNRKRIPTVKNERQTAAENFSCLPVDSYKVSTENYISKTHTRPERKLQDTLSRSTKAETQGTLNKIFEKIEFEGKKSEITRNHTSTNDRSKLRPRRGSNFTAQSFDMLAVTNRNNGMLGNKTDKQFALHISPRAVKQKQARKAVQPHSVL